MNTKTNNNAAVAVIGLGYVGLPLAYLAARKSFTVYGLDIDFDRVTRINTEQSDFTATTDFDVLKNVQTVIICVPTPVDHEHLPDLGPVKAACEEVGKRLQSGQLVILESTVNPGVSEDIVLPILEEYSGLVGGSDFSLAHCPERINPGDVKWHVENIPRVVGGLDTKSTTRAAAFYHSILDATVRKMGSLKEAEAVKIVENSFRDINIAFVNELAMSFAKLGIDVVNVIDGAATKPFSFMAHYPGVGVGGHCIPVDPYYLIEYAKTNGFHHEFLRLARNINNNMPKFTVEQLVAALKEVHKPIKNSKIALLGLAYKANIEDSRESPSWSVLEHLKELGADVRVFDPYVLEHSTVDSFDEALEGADAVLLATVHTDFLDALSPALLKEKNIPILIDGRNALHKSPYSSIGIIYKGIGR